MPPRILILYYSIYGNNHLIAQEVARGVTEAGGEVRLRTVPELVPLTVLAGDARRMRAREQQRDVAVVTLADLENIDGIILGSSSRFGTLSAPLRVFLDQTGAVCKKGAWAGKPAGVFCTTAARPDGQEATLIAMMLTLLDHGAVIVGGPFFTPESTPVGSASRVGVDVVTARELGRRVTVFAQKRPWPGNPGLGSPRPGVYRGQESTAHPGKSDREAAGGARNDDRAVENRPPERPLFQGGNRAMKVMIVDDDREFADELSELLQAAGYAVEAFTDSVAALNGAPWVKPAVILLDLKMDQIDGYQAAWYFRKIPTTATTPIIGMSGCAGNADPVRPAAACGMNTFLKKPFHPLDIIARIEQLTEAVPAGTGAADGATPGVSQPSFPFLARLEQPADCGEGRSGARQGLTRDSLKVTREAKSARSITQ